jgi:hypothetical protein
VEAILGAGSVVPVLQRVEPPPIVEDYDEELVEAADPAIEGSGLDPDAEADAVEGDATEAPAEALVN